MKDRRQALSRALWQNLRVVPPVVAVLASGPLIAMEDDRNGAIEEIVVTGQALSQRRSIEVKRNSDNIVDATVQDDIARLPDLNTAAVVRRLPGLGVQNDQGEARFAVVRGLNSTYNQTTVDGAFIASPERGSFARAVPLDVIPASLLSRVEVFKTVTPDMDHNAIGGMVNMVTRSAFESDEARFVTGQAFFGNHEQSGEGGTLDGEDETQPWRANVAAGMRFGAEEQFGLVGAFDYSIRNFEIPQIEVDDEDYTEFDDDGNNVGFGNGNGILVPTNNRVFFYNNERERIGAHLKLEWRPSDRLAAEISGMHVEFNDDERRDENRYELGTSGSASEPATIMGQTTTRGISETGFGIVGLGRFTLDRDIDQVRGAIRYELTPAVTLEGRANWTGAELDNPEVTESFQTDTSFGAVYDTSDFFNIIEPLRPDEFFDPANYAHGNRGELDRFVDDDVVEAGGDVTWSLEQMATPVEVKAGFSYRDREKEEGFEFRRFVSQIPYTLADAVDDTLADEDFQGRNDMPFRVDLDASETFFQQNRENFERVTLFQSGSEATEEIFSAYAMATVDFEPLRLIGGLRWEDTEWEGGDALSDNAVSGEYDNLLVDLVARWQVLPDLVLRGAFTQTIGRPNLTDLTRGENLDPANLTINRSNPDLEARESDNFDLSLEWYIPDGIVSAGLFYKDIENEIFTQTSTVNLDIGGVVFQTLTQPENASGGEIRGIELQYQQRLFFLPQPLDNLGFSANGTFLDTEYDVPFGDGTRETGFFQQPDTVYNLTGYFASDRFEVRVSYNYTDEFLDGINSGEPAFDVYWEDRSQLDVQARVRITEQVWLIAEGVNLNDEGRTEVTGPNRNLLQEDAEFGRTFWFGVNARF